jgi:peptide/nickel transport system substrate-binding protein
MVYSPSRRDFLRSVLSVSAGLTVVGMGTACSSGRSTGSGGSGSTGTLIVAAPSLKGLGQDYMTQLVYPSATYWDAIFDYLVEQDESGNYIPGIATAWEASADKLTWAFDIRDGVVFHNGDPMSAEDVAFSYNRLLFDPASRHAIKSRAEVVDSIKVDGKRMLLKTKTPQADVPVWFAQSDGGVSGTVVSKKYFDAQGAAKASAHPVGTGAYKFVSSSGEDSVELAAFDDAKRGDWQKTRQPKYSSVKVVAVSEESTRVSMLKSGQADAVPLTVSSIADVESAGSGMRVVKTPSASYAGMLFVGYTLNPKSPFNDKRIRQALSIAIDRQAITDSVYKGTAKPSGGFYGGPGSLGYPEDLEPPAFDSDQAKSLLSDAGFSGDMQILIKSDDTDFPDMSTLAEAIAGYYQKIGLSVKVNAMDSGALNDLQYAGKLPGQKANPAVSPATLYLRGFGNVVNVVPDQVTGYTSEGRPGRALWDYPEQEQKLKAIAAEFDADKQASMFADYYKWMAEQWNQVPLLASDAVFGVSGKVAKWQPITSKPLVNSLHTMSG